MALCRRSRRGASRLVAAGRARPPALTRMDRAEYNPRTPSGRAPAGPGWPHPRPSTAMRGCHRERRRRGSDLPAQPLPAGRALGTDHGPLGRQRRRAGRDRDRLPHPGTRQCLRPPLRPGQRRALPRPRPQAGGGDVHLVRLRRGCRRWRAPASTPGPAPASWPISPPSRCATPRTATGAPSTPAATRMTRRPGIRRRRRRVTRHAVRCGDYADFGDPEEEWPVEGFPSRGGRRRICPPLRPRPDRGFAGRGRHRRGIESHVLPLRRIRLRRRAGPRRLGRPLHRDAGRPQGRGRLRRRRAAGAGRGA